MGNERFFGIKATIVSSFDPSQAGKYNEGGQVRTSLHYRLLKEAGVDVNVVDLTNWKAHVLRILHSVKKSLDQGRTIIVMTGPNGSRTIVPLVSWLAKKRKNKIIFVPIGAGTIQKAIEHLPEEKLRAFPSSGYQEINDSRVGKWLSRYDSILLENQYLISSYERLYGLTNCRKIVNVRETPLVHEKTLENGYIPNGDLLFFGRVSTPKGIFVLIDAIHLLNKRGIRPKLNIYGRIDMTQEERRIFDASLNDDFVYRGIASQSDKYRIFAKHKFFVLPTYWEGVPGSWVESVIAGVPSIMTRYPVAEELIVDGQEGYLTNVGDSHQLADAIEKALYHTDYHRMVANVKTLAKQYQLEGNENKIVAGLLGLDLDC